jgi:hypothetical protein
MYSGVRAVWWAWPDGIASRQNGIDRGDRATETLVEVLGVVVEKWSVPEELVRG